MKLALAILWIVQRKMCGTMGGQRHPTKDVNSGGTIGTGGPPKVAGHVKMIPSWQQTALALVAKIAEALANAYLGRHARTIAEMKCIIVILKVA